MTGRSAWGRRPSEAPAWSRTAWHRHAELPLPPGPQSWLPQGRRRSYGDVCLNPGGGELSSRGLDRLIHFDRSSGIVRAESGLTLGELLNVVWPEGWVIPVLPGTRNVTLGGAVANDVHGKNHELRGSFGEHVLALELVGADGLRRVCSRRIHGELFAATVAGLGLTGFVTWVELQLCRAEGRLVECEEHAFASLADYVQLDGSLRTGWEFRVAWLDGTRVGRGILSLGRFAPGSVGADMHRRGGLALPFTPPFNLVRPAAVHAFNACHARRPRSARPQLVAPGPFFFPLDGVRGWNRAYGPRGFFQYQCVLCGPGQAAAATDLLHCIRRGGQTPGLIVAKRFGARVAPGLLSFARPGITLAIDLPDRGPATLALLDQLDRLVRQADGAVYPAKDARMGQAMFEQGFPAVGAFRAWVDPQISSAFWRRVSGDEP